MEKKRMKMSILKQNLKERAGGKAYENYGIRISKRRN